MLESLAIPIVQAPMAGGPSTPALAAAVSEAGALGFVAAGYKTAAAMGSDIEQTRSRTQRPFGINLFVPGDGPADRAVVESYRRRLEEAIEAKIEGNEITVTPAEAPTEKVVDLLEALKASVDQTRTKRSA